MTSGGGLNLGFRIEEQYIGTDGEKRYMDSFIVRETGQRLATPEEVAMWEERTLLLAILEAAEEYVEARIEDYNAIRGRHLRNRIRDALAAFRAAKEKQR